MAQQEILKYLKRHKNKVFRRAELDGKFDLSRNTLISNLRRLIMHGFVEGKQYKGFKGSNIDVTYQYNGANVK